MTFDRTRTRALALVLTFALLSAACGGSDDDATSDSDTPTDVDGDTPPADDATAAPNPPPVNSFLADGVVPIGHFDSAQSDSLTIAGPTGSTETLTEADGGLTYTHLGPAHFGIATSPAYPDGSKVVWSNGGDRVSKLDAETLDVLAELPIPGKALLSESEADDVIEQTDTLEGDELANAGIGFAAEFLTGISGVYYLLDLDNTLFVGGAESIIAYQDVDRDDPTSAIEVRDEFGLPEGVTGAFVGANLTFDGKIVMVTDEGWIVVVESDFSDFQSIQMAGAEIAPQFNVDRLAEGFRPGAASWVRNSIAVGEDGGIYVASNDDMHKVIWNGEMLSTDEADGAWVEPYANGTGQGTGATPSLMGFGDEDQFVVITDGDAVMNVVLFWRGEIPEGFDSRLAGSQPANMGDPALTSIQTEQSVVIGGYGALVVNNDPASTPPDFPPVGSRVLSGYAGADPAFTPSGVQKFEWDPDTQAFDEAWVTTEISSANSVPVVSTGSNIVYTVGARDGDWTLEGIDWLTGESAFHFVTGSGRYNSLFSGINLDEQGRVIHTTAFGIVRYEREP